MKIEITIPELEQFIQSYFKVSIGIEYSDFNKVKVSYMTTFKINVLHVDDYSVLFGYKINPLTHLVVWGTKFFMKEKFKSDVLQWNVAKKEIQLNLKEIIGLKGFLNIYRIHSFEIFDNKVILEMVI